MARYRRSCRSNVLVVLGCELSDLAHVCIRRIKLNCPPLVVFCDVFFTPPGSLAGSPLLPGYEARAAGARKAADSLHVDLALVPFGAVIHAAAWPFDLST